MAPFGKPSSVSLKHISQRNSAGGARATLALAAVAAFVLLIPLVSDAGLPGEPLWGMHALAAAILTLRWGRSGAVASLLASASIYLLAHIGPFAALLSHSAESTRALLQALLVNLVIVGAVAWCALRLTQTAHATRLHAERARLASTIFNDAANPIVTLSGDGTITMFNPAAEQLTGYAAGEVVGRQIFETGMIAASAVAEAAHNLKLRLDGQEPAPVAFELIRKDGSSRTVESHSRAIRDGEHVTGLQAILRDITERNATDRALRDSEDLQRAIMSSLDAGVIYQTIDGLLLSNPSAERILGLTNQQLRSESPHPPGRMLLDADGSPLSAAANPAHIALRTGIVQTGVVMGVRHGGGMTTWLLINSRPIFRPNLETPYGAVTSFTDITSLRESDERYRAAMGSSLDAVQMLRAVRDAAGAIVDFEYLDLNLPAEEFLRISRKQAIGTRVSALFPAYVATGFFRTYAQVVETGQSVQEELHDPTPGFEDFWIHQQIAPISDGIAITSQDITPRKRAEQALVENMDQQRELIAALDEGIVLRDASGAIVSCNSSALRILGLTEDQLLGQTSLSPLGQAIRDDGSPFPDELHPALLTLQTGLPQSNVIMGVKRPDHLLTWISINARPLIRDGERLPYAVVVSFADITERRARETDRLLLRDLAMAISSVDDVQSALRVTLEEVCRVTGWEYAESWLLDDAQQTITMSTFWSQDDRLDVLVEHRKAAHFQPGVGLPGQIWARGEVVWWDADSPEPWMLRADVAREVGLTTGIGVPIKVDDRVVAALIFLIHEQRSEAERLLVPIIAVTAQLGSLVERKRAEGALRRSQQELSSLTDNAPDIIVRFNREYRRLFVNPALERLTGLRRDQMVGTTIFESNQSAAYTALWVSTIDDVFTTRAPRSFEFDFQTSAGQRWYQAHLVPEITIDGNVETILATSRDVTERRQAEAALRHSQQELKTLTDNVPDNVARYNREYQRIYVNPAFARTIGKSREEIIGKTIRETSLNPAHNTRWEVAIDAVFEHGQPVELELDIPSPTGIRWHQIRLVPELDNAGGIVSVLGMGRDITERKRAEDALQQSEREMKALTDNAPDAIGRFNRDYRHVFVNPALAATMGRSVDDVIGRTIWETSRDGVGIVQWADALERVFSSGVALETEFEYPSVHGPLWLQSQFVPELGPDGEVRTVLAISRDITEARLAAQNLRESQELFRSAFDDATIGMALVSTDGRFLQVNAALCAMLGYNADELVVTDFQTITHADDLTADLDYVRQMLQGTIPTYQMEKRYIRKDGEVFWILLGVSLVRNAAGQPLYFIAQIQDINERKRLEMELSHRAYHDPLTNLPNRGLFENRLEHALTRAYRRRDQIAVMYLDLDGFKMVNDTLGHAAGDQMLTEVGQRLRGCARESDTVARLGGDEFTILLEDVLDSMSIVRIADRIIKAVSQPFDLDAGPARVSCSIGIAFSHAEHGHYEAPQDVLARADAALYEAKSRGRGRYVISETLQQAVVVVDD